MATRERSPNYPTIDLEAAVAAIASIYKSEKRGQIPWSLAAKAMGYQALSGPVRSRIAALRQYGLIETTPGEHLRISEHGFDLVASPKGSPAYMAALRDAALEPPLFRELLPAQEQSDDALIYRLQREKRFSEEGARRAIRAFRATMTFAKLDEERYDGGTGDDGIEDDTVQEARQETRLAPAGTRTPPPSAAHEYSFPVEGMKVFISFVGGEPTPQAWETLQDYINIAKREAARRGSSAAPRASFDNDDASSLSAEARDLLGRVENGSVPLYTTANLMRIAEENGVAVSSDMTPNEIVERLRERTS